jgi:hypothetical protein
MSDDLYVSFDNLVRQKKYYEAHELLHLLHEVKLISVAGDMMLFCVSEFDLQFVNQILGELRKRPRSHFIELKLEGLVNAFYECFKKLKL